MLDKRSYESRLLILMFSFSLGRCVSEPAFAVSNNTIGEGTALFHSCDFKRAAATFERALASNPNSGELMFWAGKSYARMAEIASPLSVSRDVRTARKYLEQAVAIDPQNVEYARELFSLYVDFPEWIPGGLRRAGQLAARMGPGESERVAAIAAARADRRGPSWWIQRAVSGTTAAVGEVARIP